MTATEDIVIRQGETFRQVLRWETSPIVYKAITAITQSAPVSITCPSHGLLTGWRVAIVSVKGMTNINAAYDPPRNSDYHPITVVDGDTLTINSINSAGFKSYVSGGYLQSNTPQVLTGYTARMDIKDKVGGTILDSLTDSNGKILIDATNHAITISLSALATAAYAWTSGVYDLELVAATGEVTTLVSGSVSVIQEVTT
jgi:hypothetical protein